MADALEKFPKERFHEMLQDHLRDLIKEHKRVLFNGDGYTDEWEKEAARRGLPNARTTLDAVKALVKEENVALFERYGVLNRRELESRYEIAVDGYARRIAIEANMALDMAGSMVFPAVKAEYSDSLDAYTKAVAAGIVNGTDALKANVETLGAGLDSLKACLASLSSAMGGPADAVIKAMADLRETVDALERRVADERWPLPKYREMLFLY